MELLQDVIQFMRDDPDRMYRLTSLHLRLSLASLVVAFLVFVPLGVLLSRVRGIGSTLVGSIASLRVIPSLALIFLLFSVLGTGFRTAMLAIVILAGPPIILNTFTGMQNVDRATLEAARGVGMNEAQVFLKVQFPLALPVVIAGVRTAMVEILASATLAAFIGVRTLGELIVTGGNLLNSTYLLAGALPIMALVLTFEAIFGGVERLVTPRSSAQ